MSASCYPNELCHECLARLREAWHRVYGPEVHPEDFHTKKFAGNMGLQHGVSNPTVPDRTQEKVTHADAHVAAHCPVCRAKAQAGGVNPYDLEAVHRYLGKKGRG